MLNNGLINRQNLAGKKVVIGMTGRVDSALSAFLLKKQGMEVIGLAIINHDPVQSSTNSQQPKCQIQDLDQVQRLCEHMGIAFYATNAKSRFESEVLDQLASNKLSAMANRSCFTCTITRAQILYEKMLELDADFIATGHYAKATLNVSSRQYFVHASADENSDQSFLLAGVPSQILQHLLLPLGELSKREIEKYAKHFKMPTQPSLDRKDFCYESKQSSAEVIEKRLPASFLREGAVEHISTGAILGEHKGVIYHHLSEREPKLKQGSHVDKKLEIVGYDFKSASLKMGPPDKLRFKGLQLTRCVFGEGVNKSAPMPCFIKFKYSKELIKALVFFKNNNSVFLEFSEPVYPLIPGEVIVVYDGAGNKSKVLAWGVAGQRGEFKPLNRVAQFESLEDEDSIPDELDGGEDSQVKPKGMDPSFRF